MESLFLLFPLIFFASSFYQSVDPPRPKIGAKMRQSMFLKTLFLGNRQTFQILPFTILIDLPLSSSTLVFILSNLFYQYPGHIFININKSGYSLNPCLTTTPTPRLCQITKNQTPVVLSHHTTLPPKKHGYLPLTKETYYHHNLTVTNNNHP